MNNSKQDAVETAIYKKNLKGEVDMLELKERWLRANIAIFQLEQEWNPIFEELIKQKGIRDTQMAEDMKKLEEEKQTLKDDEGSKDEGK